MGNASLGVSEARDLSKIASNLKRVATIEGILSFFSGYCGVVAGALCWYSGLLLVILLFVLALPDGPAALVFGLLCVFLLLIALLALLCLAVARLANTWRRCNTAALVLYLSPLFILTIIVTIFAVAVLLTSDSRPPQSDDNTIYVVAFLMLSLTSLPALGIAGSFGLRRASIHGALAKAAPIRSLGGVLNDGRSLEKLAGSEAQRRRNRAIMTEFFWAGGQMVGCGIGIGIIAFLATAKSSASSANFVTIVAIISTFVLSFFVSSRLARRIHDTRRLIAPTAPDARAADPRAPILLLRSFIDEASLGQGD